MASPHHHLFTPSAPPPTPSATTTPTTTDTDALSHLLLHRLSPSLSLPSRAPSPLPTLSLSDITSSNLSNRLDPEKYQDRPCFQLTHHPISPKLASSADSDALSLLHHPPTNTSHFPPGFHDNDDDNDCRTTSLCIDFTTRESELTAPALQELTGELERLGLEVVEMLSCAVGFDNPLKGACKYCPLTWVYEYEYGGSSRVEGRAYPYIVGLQYQRRTQKYTVHTDSGPITVAPEVGSVLVTLGDIAQVWSNGKTKKVRGIPTPTRTSTPALLSNHDEQSPTCTSMTMLLTLPLHATVSPLLPLHSKVELETNKVSEKKTHDQSLVDGEEEEERVKDWAKYKSFKLEEYAWRVYNERLPFMKDPLHRYRILPF